MKPSPTDKTGPRRNRNQPQPSGAGSPGWRTRGEGVAPAAATTSTRSQPSKRLAGGPPQEALDCACGLCLRDTTAWLDPPPPTN